MSRAMPESKRRKPKKPNAGVQTAKPPPPRRNWWGVVKRVAAFIAVVAGLLIALWPQVSVEPANSPEPSNPFSSIFKISNGQIYPIHQIHITAYQWCVKMGTGTDTSRPDRCEKGNIRSSLPLWNKDIGPRGFREIEAGNVLYATPPYLLYAEISIEVSYQPWFLPIPLMQEGHFYTRRKDNGEIEWLSM